MANQLMKLLYLECWIVLLQITIRPMNKLVDQHFDMWLHRNENEITDTLDELDAKITSTIAFEYVIDVITYSGS